jgi:DNA-binding NtrC family response regulator
MNAQFQPNQEQAPQAIYIDTVPLRMRDAIISVIIVALVISSSKQGAANLLGITRSKLKRDLEKYDIDAHMFLAMDASSPQALDLMTAHKPRLA